jgi:hypothetical protein
MNQLHKLRLNNNGKYKLIRDEGLCDNHAIDGEPLSSMSSDAFAQTPRLSKALHPANLVTTGGRSSQNAQGEAVLSVVGWRAILQTTRTCCLTTA